MLKEKLNERIKTALREKNEVEKSVLRVVLGEVQKLETDQGKALEDNSIVKIVKKVMVGNDETLKALLMRMSSEAVATALHGAEGDLSKDRDTFARLTKENEILVQFLPKELTEEDILSIVSEIKDQILAVPANGAAIGVASKFLKSKNIVADGKLLSSVVTNMRSV